MIREVDWAELQAMVSPVFFELFPPQQLLREASHGVSNYLSQSRFNAACSSTTHTLGLYGVPIQLVDKVPRFDSATLDPATAEARGAWVLELYFMQLFSAGPALLDVSSGAFASVSGASLEWAPRRLYTTWSAEFKTGLCELYRGFYAADTQAFLRGAERLGVAAASDVLWRYFGSNQDIVRFDVRRFRAAFHAVFVCCTQAHRGPLSPEFLTFGIHLGLLHEHLERLGVALDVRGAYERTLLAAQRLPTAHTLPA